MRMSHPIKIIIRLNLLAIIALLFMVEPAHALQSHSYTGLHVHEFAHVFLLFAMVLFGTAIPTWRKKNRGD